jgi:hypothetical protein
MVWHSASVKEQAFAIAVLKARGVPNRALIAAVEEERADEDADDGDGKRRTSTARSTDADTIVDDKEEEGASDHFACACSKMRKESNVKSLLKGKETKLEFSVSMYTGHDGIQRFLATRDEYGVPKKYVDNPDTDSEKFQRKF